MSNTPPIPHDQQSKTGGASPASRDSEVSRDPARDKSQVNLKEQGDAANLHQNLSQPHNLRGR